ncbi:hypothetical protein ABFS83_04G161200 [Erythranthe nasuta]
MAAPMKGFEKKKSSLMFIEMTPPHAWKDDLDFHYLRLTLPGFEAKDVHLRVDKYGHLVVRGDKKVSEHKYVTFEETFDVPNNADLENADGIFEQDQIYCVTIPKTSKGGKITGHAIAIPHELDNNNNNINTNLKPPDSIITTGSIIHKRDNTKNNPLQVIRRDKYSKKKIAFFVAVLIALFVVAVVLTLKFRRR